MKEPVRFPARIAVLMLAMLMSLAGPLAAQQKAEKPAPPKVDLDELIAECQLTIKGDSVAGMVWWIPVEFWEVNARKEGMTDEKVAELVKPLRDYTMVAVVAGKIGGFGAISWISASDLRANTVLRDAAGTEYKPVAEVSADAQILAAVMRPIFSQAIGKMGENIEILFFPGKNGKGVPLADPAAKGSFSIVLKSILGIPEDVYEWKLPLSALSPPKYCPIDKALMKGNWAFCPWHGVKLEGGGQGEKKP